MFVHEIGVDVLDASITSALFMLTAGVVIYVLAKWEDRSRHRRKFVVLGYGISVLGYIGYLFVASPFSLFVVQIILGLAVAFKDPAYDALFSKSDKHVTLAWGEWEAMDYFVYGIGALAGGFIVNSFGFAILLWIMLGFSIISFIVSLLLLQIKNKNL